MQTSTYKCENCEHEFENIRLSEKQLKERRILRCPECHSTLLKELVRPKKPTKVMKFYCKDCKYEQNVHDRSLKRCPQCGSKNKKIFKFYGYRSWIPEKVVLSTPEAQPEEQPEELEVVQEEEELVVRDLEEIPIEEEVLQEEKAAVSPPEDQPEELIPPEPQIIKCPFCGRDINEETAFCSQCGMIFKRK